MRVLIYGMQSSGASMLALTLAQKPESVAFVDIWNMFAAPDLETDRDCVAKTVVTTAYSLEVHKHRFRPDVTILLLRQPVDTYESLIGKSYANEAGLIDEKFTVLEEVFRSGNGFDQVVYYEDLIFSPRTVITALERLGWQIGYEALLYGRSQQDIERANAKACPGIDVRLKYGGGNVRTGGMLRDRVRFAKPWGKSAHLPGLCPFLWDHYVALREERREVWHVPTRALMSCSLHSVLRELTSSGPIPPKSERAGYVLHFENGGSECSVGEREIRLLPGSNATKTELVVSGLPGKPFNRLRAAACGDHPFGAGTTLRLRIEDGAAECLAEQEVTLRHSDMRNIDLIFTPHASTLVLRLCVGVVEGVDTVQHAGVRLQDLRLEQASV